MWENKSNGAMLERLMLYTRHVYVRCRCPPAISGRCQRAREERKPTSPQVDIVPTPPLLVFGPRPFCISPLCVLHKRP